MANQEDLRPVGEFTRLFAAEVKGAMKSAGVTQPQVAEAMSRNQSYVSERVSAKRAFTTEDLDVIARLCGQSPKAFITEIARRTRDIKIDSDLAGVTPIVRTSREDFLATVPLESDKLAATKDNSNVPPDRGEA